MQKIKKNKMQRIMDNIFDILHNADFKDTALKEYRKDTKNMDIEIDWGKNVINYYGKNERLLYTIKIN